MVVVLSSSFEIESARWKRSGRGDQGGTEGTKVIEERSEGRRKAEKVALKSTEEEIKWGWWGSGETRKRGRSDEGEETRLNLEKNEKKERSQSRCPVAKREMIELKLTSSLYLNNQNRPQRLVLQLLNCFLRRSFLLLRSHHEHIRRKVLRNDARNATITAHLPHEGLHICTVVPAYFVVVALVQEGREMKSQDSGTR